MNKYEQAKFQLAKYIAKAQFIAVVVNLNTEGRARVEFEPRYNRLELTFAPNLKEYDTQSNDLTGELIDCHEYVRRKPEPHFTEEDNYKHALKAIRKTRQFIAIVEEFLKKQGDFSLEDCKEVGWYTETIKYRVYTLD